MSTHVQSDIITMPKGSCTTPNCRGVHFEVLYHIHQVNKVYDVKCLNCGDMAGRFTAKEGIVYNMGDILNIPNAECRYCEHNLFIVIGQV